MTNGSNRFDGSPGADAVPPRVRHQAAVLRSFLSQGIRIPRGMNARERSAETSRQKREHKKAQRALRLLQKQHPELINPTDKGEDDAPSSEGRRGCAPHNSETGEGPGPGAQA